MDQITYQANNQNQEILQSSFQISYEDITYIASLQFIDQRLEIIVTQEDQPAFKWKELFSIEQIYKLQNFFLQYTSLQTIYEILSKLIKSCIKSITKIDNKMQIMLEFEQFLGKISFSLSLNQCEINTDDAIVKICEKITAIESKSNKQFDQIIKDQSAQTDYLVKQIELMKECLTKQIESLKTDHQNEIKELKNEIKKLNNEITLMQQKIFSNIISQEELEMISKWISGKQINLQLIYRATNHGFQIEKIYEWCKDKKKVILIIKTIENKRFGFYADCEIKNYNGSYLAQNPNNIFLFSLDLKQKYTSDETNHKYAFYSCGNTVRVGNGHDILLYSNSNSNKHSYVNCSSYGKKEGLTQYALNGGSQYFTTSEVEIFEIIDI